MSRILLASFSCLALFACPGPQVDCRVGADCASGVCLRDGTCGPVEDAGTGGGAMGGGGGSTGGGAGGGMVGGGSGGGGGSTGGGAGGGSVGGGTGGGGSVGCIPNDDGVIERSEVFFEPGLRATFKISGAATFDTAGTAAPDGGRSWDFTPALAGDTSRLVETKPLAGEWYESKYPDAGYVTELGQGSPLLGVFSATGNALYLQGVVAPNADGGTEVHYAPWVKVLQFPLQAGGSWGTTTTVSGKYQGFVIGNAAFGTGLPFQEENYTSTVDRSGDALTPFSNFHTLRVRTVMVRSTRIYTAFPFMPILTLRSFNWNTECFGTVATLTSTDNESSTEFTNAAEVRRLSP